MSWLERLEASLRDFRENTYPKVRNSIHDALLQPGGKGSDESAKGYFHGKGNYLATKKLGQYLPPDVAANIVDSLYLGNEAITGGLAKSVGEPFFSDYGFRWKDIPINRGGQDKAVRELRAEMEMRRRMRDLEAAGILGGNDPT